MRHENTDVALKRVTKIEKRAIYFVEMDFSAGFVTNTAQLHEARSAMTTFD